MVSDRPVGPNTTQVYNRGVNGTDAIPAYLIFHGALIVGHAELPALRLTIQGENLLNRNLLDPNDPHYYHPGPRAANGSFQTPEGFVPYVPQRDRFITAKLSVEL